MQQARHHAWDIKLHIGDDLGHLDRMDEVGLARETFLPLVHALREVISPSNEVSVCLGVVGAHLIDEFTQCHTVFLPWAVGEVKSTVVGWARISRDTRARSAIIIPRNTATAPSTVSFTSQ